MIRVALELVPTLEDLSSSDPPLGNFEHLETHLPRSWLAGSPICRSCYKWLHHGFWVLDGH